MPVTSTGAAFGTEVRHVRTPTELYVDHVARSGGVEVHVERPRYSPRALPSWRADSRWR